MFPLISVALARPAYRKSAKSAAVKQVNVLRVFISVSFVTEFPFGRLKA
jgi:hypothetical protein